MIVGKGRGGVESRGVDGNRIIIVVLVIVLVGKVIDRSMMDVALICGSSHHDTFHA